MSRYWLPPSGPTKEQERCARLIQREKEAAVLARKPRNVHDADGELVARISVSFVDRHDGGHDCVAFVYLTGSGRSRVYQTWNPAA